MLGLIFEKINGYRDGSFFTPGFITMYMCRETIRRAVLRKFNEKYGWSCESITDLYNSLDISKIAEANRLVDSLKICDPAVGSGHFLVSALNEIIAIKSELGILVDRDGKRLRDYHVEIENDELIVMQDDRLFEYNYKDPESQRVQEALFHEKEKIIENCLFGVDINPKSVMICRLRLWIELLKNAYYSRYSNFTELETLPNIDINIKCGNSLISRFAVSGDAGVAPAERRKLRELTEKYRRYVTDYKISTPTTATKGILRKYIADLKNDLEKFGTPTDKDLAELRRKENQLDQLPLFAPSPKEASERQKTMDEVDALKKRLDDKQRTIYADAFEWRFEFPEVLDGDGNFAGFDAVIGNPPYIRIQDLKISFPLQLGTYKQKYLAASKGNYDIYVLFVERGLSLLSRNGDMCFILPHKFFNSEYGKAVRAVITEGNHLRRILHFKEHQVFEEATTYCCLLFLNRGGSPAFTFTSINDLRGWRNGREDTADSRVFASSTATSAEWNFTAGAGAALVDKLHALPIKLGELADIFVGVQTSADTVFIMDLVEEKSEGVVLRSRELGVEWFFERALVHPLASGTDVTRYGGLPTRQYILFPYRVADGKAELIPLSEITERWPYTAEFFSRNQEKLENREGGKLKGKGWHGYIYLKNMGKQLIPKICIPRLVDSLYAGYDASGSHVLDNVDVGGVVPKAGSGLDICLFLGLLNSALLRWYFPHVSAPFRGGWLSANRQFLSQLPLPSGITTGRDAAIYDRIAELAREVIRDGGNAPDSEAEIDRLVYDLYGLTEEEISLVEGKKQ